MRGRVFSARFTLTRVAYMGSISLLSFAANSFGVVKVYVIAGFTLFIGTIVVSRVSNNFAAKNVIESSE